jgi:hypothetical protein
MKIKEFLRGPLPDDVLHELETNFGAPLTRLYVMGFKGRYVNPDGRAEEVLAKFGLLAQGGGVRPCTAGYGVVGGRWYGPPAPAVGRYVDVASSDALFAGAPRRCGAAEAKPVITDIIRLDRDFKAPRFIVKRVDGKVQLIDRGSGVVVKEFDEKKYSAKAAAKALGVPLDELIKAERWGEDGSAPLDAIRRQIKFVAERAARKKLDFRVMFSGAKGVHVLFTLERPVPAGWRPAIAKKLAEWLDVEADPATFDPARKLRVPWTVHTETGRLAVFVDPKTLEPIEFDWPKPIPYALAKTLAALGMSASLLIPRWPEATRPKPRRTGWVPYLEAVAAANPSLKSDCRKRFSALFGCACAVDGLGAEACAERLAASLGSNEMPREYLSAMKRGLEVCAKRIAEGRKPLFSIKRALALDAGDGEGKVWYSIKECIAALPKPKWAAEEERAAPADVDMSQGQSGLTTSPPPAGGHPVVSESAAASPQSAGVSGVVSPQMPLTQLEGQKEEVEAVSSVGKEQSGLTTGPHAPTTEVVNPPNSLTESRGHVANIELAPAASISVSQEQREITISPPLTPAQTYNIDKKVEVSPPAETAESRKLSSAEDCLATPICMNRLIVCLWKHLKVPKEEKKAALYAEIERRGELFSRCLEDALEYARRESEP